MTKEISELPLKSVPQSTDEMETQIAGNGASRKITLGSLTALLGAGTPAFYMDYSDVNDDATFTVSDFTSNTTRAMMWIVVDWDQGSSDTNAIFEITSSTVITWYIDATIWTNGGASAGAADDDGKMNIYLDTGPTPDQVKIKNRSGGTRGVRVFTFSNSTGGV